MELVAFTVMTGIGATAVMDLWGLVRRRLFGVPVANYALVGRWLGHMPQGQFRHDAIGRAPPVRHEAVIGWTAHYVIGIAFAFLLPAVWGRAWFCAPTLVAALAVGIGTVVAPFLLMQPGMGAGFFACRTPRPTVARLHSLATHAMFGFGLYMIAVALPLNCAR